MRNLLIYAAVLLMLGVIYLVWGVLDQNPLLSGPDAVTPVYERGTDDSSTSHGNAELRRIETQALHSRFLTIVVRNHFRETLEGAEIKVASNTGGTGSLLVAAGTTDADGRFTLDRLPGEDVEVGVHYSGYQRSSLLLHPQTGNQELVVVLRGAGVVRGRALSISGRPVPGTKVLVCGPDIQPGSNVSGKRSQAIASLTVDAQGYFELSGLNPIAEYDVQVRHSSYLSVPNRPIRVIASGTPIVRTLAPVMGAFVVFVDALSGTPLEFPRTGRGVVFNAEKPAKLKSILYYHHLLGESLSEGQEAVDRVASGKYRDLIFVNMDPREFLARETVAGRVTSPFGSFGSIEGRVVLHRRGTREYSRVQEVRVKRIEGGVLCRVMIRDPVGAPFSGRQMRFTMTRRLLSGDSNDVSFNAVITLDEEGRSKGLVIPPGEYDLQGTVALEGHPSVVIPEALPRQEPHWIKLVLPRNGTLRVMPKTTDGHVPMHYIVRFVRKIDGDRQGIYVMHSHRYGGRPFTKHDLPFGTYVCTVEVKGFGKITKTIVLEDSEPVVLPLSFSGHAR